MTAILIAVKAGPGGHQSSG